MVTAVRLGPALGVALVAIAIARLTMLPGVGFWDTAELQAVAPLLGTAHPTGFPTYVILGWLASHILAPFGEPALRVNLFAALCVGLAAGVTVDLVRAVTRSTWLGVAAGLGLAVTPIVWRLGTHAETHALHLAFVAVLLRLLVAWEERRRVGEPTADRWLVAAAVAGGLAAGNHSLTLLLVPPVALFVLAVEPAIWRRPRFVATCAAAVAATVVLVYLQLPLRAGPFPAPLVYGRPDTWDGFWYVVLAEQFRGSLVDPFGDLGGKVAALAELAWVQFGPLALLLPAAFVATVARRPRLALLTGSAVLITCFFAASYVNADIGRYYAGPILIGWLWLAILASVGAEATVGAVASRLSVPASATAAVPALLAALLVAPSVDALPARWAAIDESRTDIGQRWLDAAMERLEPDAVVISWWSFSTTLWYGQHVEGRRPDIVIVDDRTRLDRELGAITDVIEENLGRRPVYVIRSDPRERRLLEERYELERVAMPVPDSLTRVVAPRGARS
jgi:hypothetical protein